MAEAICQSEAPQQTSGLGQNRMEKPSLFFVWSQTQLEGTHIYSLMCKEWGTVFNQKASLFETNSHIKLDPNLK